MRFDEVLTTFTREMERLDLRYAVIGGLAVQALGLSRFTRDIDLVVESSGRDAVICFAESLGYETLHASEGYSNHLHADETMGRIDFMYVTPEDVAALERVGAHDVLGPVEYLAFLKAFAARHPPTREIPEGHEPFKL